MTLSQRHCQRVARGTPSLGQAGKTEASVTFLFDYGELQQNNLLPDVRAGNRRLARRLGRSYQLPERVAGD
jgi:hypothetical protein